MRRGQLQSMLLGVALCALAPPADAFYGYESGFEADPDGYEVSDTNPFNDPPAGLVPGSWFDVRDGLWEGLIEEATSGTRGIPSASGSSHAEIYAQETGGDRPGPTTSNGGAQQSHPGEPYAFGIDIYLDPDWSPQGTSGDGRADIEWVSWVSHAFSGGAYTRAGITIEVLDTDGNGLRNYVIASYDAGHATYNTEEPGWYRFEVVVTTRPDGPDAQGFPDVFFEHNLYTRDHTLLWKEVHQDFGQVNGAFLGGDAFSSFDFVAANIPFVAVDNQRVGVPIALLPEPGTLALTAITGLLLLRRPRRPKSGRSGSASAGSGSLGGNAASKPL